MNLMEDFSFVKGNCDKRRSRVVLRADAGRNIGYGHFVRSCALAGYLRDDFDCLMVTRNPDGLLSEFQIRTAFESGAAIMVLKASDIEEADREFLDIIRPDDIVVLDNYYFSTVYQSIIRDKAKALVCIDDMHDRHFVSDVVMTFCPLRRDQFSMEAKTEFYGGVEWSFLRGPFLVPHPERKNLSSKGRIVIAIGGADPLGLTDKMIGVVRRVCPDKRIEVITGNSIRQAYTDDDKVTLHRQLDARSIALLFDNSDWGLFPASTVCIEAFSRHLPVVAGYFVDNQEEFYARGVEKGWFGALGALTDDADLLAERLNSILSARIPEAPEINFTNKRKEIVSIFKKLAKR